MAEERDFRIEDDIGNIYYPHTKATNVLCTDGQDVEAKIKKLPNVFIGNDPTEEEISQMKNGDIYLILEPLIPPKTMYYSGGNEYTSATGGWKLGNHGTNYTNIFQKESNYLYLESSETGEGSSSNCACNTTSKIDFSNINYLCIEWENVGESSTDNVSRFGLSDINNGLPNIKLLLKENTFSRRIDRIDVSDVNASYYIEIAARMLNSKDSKIKIYNVWGE